MTTNEFVSRLVNALTNMELDVGTYDYEPGDREAVRYYNFDRENLKEFFFKFLDQQTEWVIMDKRDDDA